MKTSGGFRSEADTQKMSSPPPTHTSPSYPSAGPHNSEEPSCGNVIVWWWRRWSKQCDRMPQRLPGWGPRHACHARAGLTLQVLMYAATLASEMDNGCLFLVEAFSPPARTTFSSDLGSLKGGAYVYLLEDIDFFPPPPPFLFFSEQRSVPLRAFPFMHPLPILHSSYLLTDLTTRCCIIISQPPA